MSQPEAHGFSGIEHHNALAMRLASFAVRLQAHQAERIAERSDVFEVLHDKHKTIVNFAEARIGEHDSRTFEITANSETHTEAHTLFGTIEREPPRSEYKAFDVRRYVFGVVSVDDSAKKRVQHPVGRPIATFDVDTNDGIKEFVAQATGRSFDEFVSGKRFAPLQALRRHRAANKIAAQIADLKHTVRVLGESSEVPHTTERTRTPNTY